MVGNVGNQENALRLGQGAEDVDVLRIVSVRRIGESRKNGIDGDSEDVLPGLSVEAFMRHGSILLLLVGPR